MNVAASAVAARGGAGSRAVLPGESDDLIFFRATVNLFVYAPLRFNRARLPPVFDPRQSHASQPHQARITTPFTFLLFSPVAILGLV
jgi:hypothetical protein